MHEYHLIENLIRTVLSQIKDNRVKEVYIRKGYIQGHSQESFIRAYEVLTKNTVLEGSRLVIESKDVQIKCEKCGYEGTLNSFDDLLPISECPRCNQLVEINLPGGIELTKLVYYD